MSTFKKIFIFSFLAIFLISFSSALDIAAVHYQDSENYTGYKFQINLKTPLSFLSYVSTLPFVQEAFFENKYSIIQIPEPSNLELFEDALNLVAWKFFDLKASNTYLAGYEFPVNCPRVHNTTVDKYGNVLTPGEYVGVYYNFTSSTYYHIENDPKCTFT